MCSPLSPCVHLDPNTFVHLLTCSSISQYVHQFLVSFSTCSSIFQCVHQFLVSFPTCSLVSQCAHLSPNSSCLSSNVFICLQCVHQFLISLLMCSSVAQCVHLSPNVFICVIIILFPNVSLYMYLQKTMATKCPRAPILLVISLLMCFCVLLFASTVSEHSSEVLYCEDTTYH